MKQYLINQLEAIRNFRDTNDKLITYKELSKIPLNTLIQIDPENLENIECTRITSNSDSLIFTVSIKKNALWHVHHHNCIETILVYKGELEDILTKKKATRAETMIFNPKESHYVKANEDSVFYVEFTKPN